MSRAGEWALMVRGWLCAGVLAALATGASGQSITAPGSFELVATIGLDDGPAPYLFGQVRDVEVGPRGEVAVLDFMAGDVRIFDPDGRHRATVGGFGGGPGEFAMPLALLPGDASFYVVDPQAGRETEFSWAGELGEDQPLPAPPSTTTGFRTPLGGGVFAIGIAMWSSRAALPSTLPELVLFYSAPANRVDTLASYHTGGMPWRGESGAGGIEGFHEPGGAWAVVDDSTVVTVDGSTGGVTWWRVGLSGSSAIRTVETGIVPDELTPSDQDRILRRFRAQRAQDARLARYVTGEIEVAAPANWAGVRRILRTSTERLWLEVGAGRAGYFGEMPSTRWVVLDPATGASSEIDLPEGLRPMRVDRGRVYGINQTSMGSDVVEIYSFQEG